LYRYNVSAARGNLREASEAARLVATAHSHSPEAWNLYAHAAVCSGSIPRCLRVLARTITAQSQQHQRRVEHEQQQQHQHQQQGGGDDAEALTTTTTTTTGAAAAGAVHSLGEELDTRGGTGHSGGEAAAEVGLDAKRVPVLLMSGLMHSLQGAWWGAVQLLNPVVTHSVKAPGDPTLLSQ
jgi:hypothetical protein